MQNELTPPAPQRSALTAHSVEALAATQFWARFAGSAIFVVALLKLIQGAVAVAHEHGLIASGQIDHVKGSGVILGVIISTLITTVIYCFIGVFALRYAVQLDRVRPPRKPDPADIAGALSAQHKYWRLQGVLTLIAIGLILLVVILAILIAIIHVAG